MLIKCEINYQLIHCLFLNFHHLPQNLLKTLPGFLSFMFFAVPMIKVYQSLETKLSCFTVCKGVIEPLRGRGFLFTVWSLKKIFPASSCQKDTLPFLSSVRHSLCPHCSIRVSNTTNDYTFFSKIVICFMFLLIDQFRIPSCR